VTVINTSHFHFSVIFSLSVNFKKNEKVYNPEKSEVLKALQENDSEPEPGNEIDAKIIFILSPCHEKLSQR
jgi:hypothetical protein